MQIINIDKVIPEDKTIQMAGREFIISGRITMRTFLELARSSQKLSENSADGQAMSDMLDQLFRVFSAKNTITRDEFDDLVTLDRYPEIVKAIFGVETDPSIPAK